MSKHLDRSSRMSRQPGLPFFWLAWMLGVAFVSTTVVNADEVKRVDVAKSDAPTGAMQRREPDAKEWKSVGADEIIKSGDLIVGLPGASVISLNGSVDLDFLVDLDHRSPSVIFEAAILLNPTGNDEGIDMDVTLDRGRIDLTNIKNQGKARVRVRFHDQKWLVDLHEPGARVALELAGRVAPGACFEQRPELPQPPIAQLALLVLKGNVDLHTSDTTWALHAPPGPSLIVWSNHDALPLRPFKLNKLPDWATPDKDLSPQAKQVSAAIDELRKLRQTKSARECTDIFYESGDPIKQRIAMVTMAALDDLDKLGDVLANAKNPEVWDKGIIILRHWLGRNDKQEQRFFKFLVENRKFTPAHAETVLTLCHTFSERDAVCPETYDVLVEYLKHPNRAVRNLSAWHLRRLVAAGSNIPFNPQASPEEVEQTYRAWRELIPSGQLPPRGETPKKAGN